MAEVCPVLAAEAYRECPVAVSRAMADPVSQDAAHQVVSIEEAMEAAEVVMAEVMAVVTEVVTDSVDYLSGGDGNNSSSPFILLKTRNSCVHNNECNI
jgi:hypothetical protein